MAIWGKEIIGISHAVTLFHYTQRYRYTTTITTYLVRGYMVVSRANMIHCGTVYRTMEEAERGRKELQDWLKRSGKNRQAELLIVVPHDHTETVSKKRAYKLSEG